MTRIIFNEDAARAWLNTQRVSSDGDYEYSSELNVEITKEWSPRYDLDQFVTPTDVFGLVHYAGEQKNIFTTDDDRKVNVVFLYDDDSDGGGILWIAEIPLGGFNGRVLKVASSYEEYRKLGDPEKQGVEAAVEVLREAAEGANEALLMLDQYIGSL